MNDCSICCEIINTDTLTAQCGHTFHSCCLKKWKLQRKSCPMCRHDLDVGQDMFCMQDMPDAQYDALVAFFGYTPDKRV